LCHKKSVETVGAATDAITRAVNARISGELEYLQSMYVGRSIEEWLTGYTLLAAKMGRPQAKPSLRSYAHVQVAYQMKRR
jgi:hypothetical protein